jgi:hypothetical protein
LFLELILYDYRPWSLDLEGTVQYLGLIQDSGHRDDRAAETSSDVLQSWISTLGSGADNEKLISLLLMLYRSWALAIAVLACFILAVSFLAPRNRSLVISVQIICCFALMSLERYMSAWHRESQHRPSIAFLLGLNIVALNLNILDYYVYKQKIASKKS